MAHIHTETLGRRPEANWTDAEREATTDVVAIMHRVGFINDFTDEQWQRLQAVFPNGVAD